MPRAVRYVANASAAARREVWKKRARYHHVPRADELMAAFAVIHRRRCAAQHASDVMKRPARGCGMMSLRYGAQRFCTQRSPAE